MPININHTTNSIVSDIGLLTFDITGGLVIPRGTTGQRPADDLGIIRYNTSTNLFEGYSITGWDPLGATDHYTSADFDSDLADNIGSTVQGYRAVLQNTTGTFLVADQTKLDGIESNATTDHNAKN